MMQMGQGLTIVVCNILVFVRAVVVSAVKRDVAERGREVNAILHQYISTVKPSFDDFIHPTKRWADIVVPHADYNKVAVNLLCQHIRAQLAARGTISGTAPPHPASTAASASAAAATPAAATAAVAPALATTALHAAPAMAVSPSGSVRKSTSFVVMPWNSPQLHVLPESKNVKSVLPTLVFV
jgi:hypothetical protein